MFWRLKEKRQEVLDLLNDSLGELTLKNVRKCRKYYAVGTLSLKNSKRLP